jgi:hypothetical protein
VEHFFISLGHVDRLPVEHFGSDSTRKPRQSFKNPELRKTLVKKTEEREGRGKKGRERNLSLPSRRGAVAELSRRRRLLLLS